MNCVVTKTSPVDVIRHKRPLEQDVGTIVSTEKRHKLCSSSASFCDTVDVQDKEPDPIDLLPSDILSILQDPENAIDSMPDVANGTPAFDEWYGSYYTCDPSMKHAELSPLDFYNFGDARFPHQHEHADGFQKHFYCNDPFKDITKWPRRNEPLRVRETSDVDPVQLHRLVTLFVMPMNARAQAGEPKRVPSRKKVATSVPDWTERLKMWFVQQGKSVWMSMRGPAWGASSKAPMNGVCIYTFNDILFLEDTGQLSRDSQDTKSLFPMFHGHYMEPETCWVASFLLGIFVAPCGMVPHPHHAWSRASPDRLGYVPPWITWNNYLLRLQLYFPGLLTHLLMEAKSPIYNCYKFGVLDSWWPYMHKIPVHYCTQLVDQMETCDLPFNLFTVYCHANPWNAMQRVAGTDVFMVSELMVTLVFRNREYGDKMYENGKRYVDAVVAQIEAFEKAENEAASMSVDTSHVEASTPCAVNPTQFMPPRMRQHDGHLPALRMMPIAHARFFIHGGASSRYNAASLSAASTSSTSCLSPNQWHLEKEHALRHSVAMASRTASSCDPKHTKRRTFACPCCRPNRYDVYRQEIPWDKKEVRWTQRTHDDTNVGSRPVGWIGDWPPRMASHIQFFPDAQPQWMSVDRLEAS